MLVFVSSFLYRSAHRLKNDSITYGFFMYLLEAGNNSSHYGSSITLWKMYIAVTFWREAGDILTMTSDRFWPCGQTKTDFCGRRPPQFLLARGYKILEVTESLFTPGGRHSCLWSKATGVTKSQILAFAGKDDTSLTHHCQKRKNISSIPPQELFEVKILRKVIGWKKFQYVLYI